MSIRKPNLTSRQQLILQPQKPEKISQDSINELKDLIQDEELRKKSSSIEVCEFRNKLYEESLKQFKLIRKTIYLERKPTKLSIDEIMVCTCKPSQEIPSGEYAGLHTVPCGRTCLNRIVNTECCAILCISGDRCTNRRFQLQQHAQVYPIKTENRGFGLAAGQKIRKGQFIIQYVGEVYYTHSDLGRRRFFRYLHSSCTYLMSISSNEVIDPTKKGNLARFINHSCDPNCETQKWNVMGELVIGIFARRDIPEDEELTFDYKFDTHKTWFTQCFCGAANCRKYLGLVWRPSASIEEVIKCMVCDLSIEEKSIIFCESCTQGCHMSCIQIRSFTESLSSWVCDNCKPLAALKKEEVSIEITDLAIIEAIKEHLPELRSDDLQIYVSFPKGNSMMALNLRGPTCEEKAAEIKELLKSPLITQVEDMEIAHIDIRVQKILYQQGENFLKKNKGESLVEFEDISAEMIYPLNETSSYHLTGRMRSIDRLARTVMDYLERIVILTVPFVASEAAFIKSELENLRKMVAPSEIRIASERSRIATTHPFYSHRYEEVKIVLIANDGDMQMVYNMLNAWILQNVKTERENSLYFLLPANVKGIVNRFKIEITEKMKTSQSDGQFKLLLFDEGNKKFITVGIIGTWRLIVSTKESILAEIKKLSEHDISHFFQLVYSQMYLQTLRNTVRYIHSLEKETQNHQISLGYWDIYSKELLVEQNNDAVSKFRLQVLSQFNSNTEVLISLVRLADSAEDLENTLNQLGMSKEEIISKFISFNYYFPKPNAKLKYDKRSLEVVESFLIDQENNLELDINFLIVNTLDKIRFEITQKQKFSFFPVSYSTDLTTQNWEPEVNTNLSRYLENLNSREIIIASEEQTSQKASSASVLPEAKSKADVMIGCYENNQNILYVIFAGEDT